MIRSAVTVIASFLLAGPAAATTMNLDRWFDHELVPFVRLERYDMTHTQTIEMMLDAREWLAGLP